jgi:hypothetical protein
VLRELPRVLLLAEEEPGAMEMDVGQRRARPTFLLGLFQAASSRARSSSRPMSRSAVAQATRAGWLRLGGGVEARLRSPIFGLKRAA